MDGYLSWKPVFSARLNGKGSGLSIFIWLIIHPLSFLLVMGAYGNLQLSNQG